MRRAPFIAALVCLAVPARALEPDCDYMISLSLVPLAQVADLAATWGECPPQGCEDDELARRGVFYTRLASEQARPSPSSAKRGLECLEALCGRSPEDPVARSWLGLACALRSRGAWNPFEQMSSIKRAIRELDWAVNRSAGGKAEWFCRWMRGNIYCNLPRSFRKEEIGKSDELFAIAALEGDEARRCLLIGAYYYLAATIEREGESEKAMGYYRRVAALADSLGIQNNESSGAKKKVAEGAAP